MIAKQDNMELPELYKDIGFTRSTHFTLTSSQVTLRSLLKGIRHIVTVLLFKTKKYKSYKVMDDAF